MLILDTFSFPTEDTELDFIWSIQRTCYDSFYPFKTLSAHAFHRIDFEPITILYGGNGSGKTTALNVIAEKLKLPRDTIYNKSSFFPNYVQMCSYEMIGQLPANSRIITSDDVFEYILNIRNLNEGIDQKREDLFQDYIDTKYQKFQFQSMADYEQLKKVMKVRKSTQSKYIRDSMNNNVREYSNGESAFQYFTDKIDENALYLLDEPENSLSPKRQIELADYIAGAARFYRCQFVISTHSPFLLSIPGAKIYDLDENPVDCKRWTNLENVRTYRDFFLQHEKEFNKHLK
jgi:predicted ATPase